MLVIWDFHPTNGEWSLFTLTLPINGDGEWEYGTSTGIPCDEPPHYFTGFALELSSGDGMLGDCALFGVDAEFLKFEFPSCIVWE